MSSKLFVSLAMVGAATLSLGLNASATGASNEPGSLLLFPIFDNVRGGHTVITITNTNDDFTVVNPTTGQFAGSVLVEYRYINHYNCQEFNRQRLLTPNDTISVLTKLDNPNMEKGYVYAFAKNVVTGKAIKFDHLIGSELLIDAGNPDTTAEINAFVWKAGAALAEGANTDLENGGVGDGIRDLNGLEYDTSPDEILIPRFFGQDEDDDGELVLINLTGGAQFTAIIDFLVYNDNEEVFSAQYSFDCWKRVDLLDISGVFGQYFLETTNHNVGEKILNDETGWFKMDGNVAFSTNTSFTDPAFLAVRLCGENVEDLTGTLPFTKGEQDNGDLLPLGILGDVQ